MNNYNKYDFRLWLFWCSSCLYTYDCTTSRKNIQWSYKSNVWLNSSLISKPAFFFVCFLVVFWFRKCLILWILDSVFRIWCWRLQKVLYIFLCVVFFDETTIYDSEWFWNNRRTTMFMISWNDFSPLFSKYLFVQKISKD